MYSAARIGVPADDVVQVGPVRVLHDHERVRADAIDVEHVNDVRVVERCHGPRLAVEPVEGPSGIGRRTGGELQHLHRHEPVQNQVLTQVDLAHATGADEVEDLVLVGEEEAVGPVLVELSGLERSQETLGQEAEGDGFRVGVAIGKPGLELGRLKEPAALDQGAQVSRSEWRGHGAGPTSGRRERPGAIPFGRDTRIVARTPVGNKKNPGSRSTRANVP
jgi:hypothetical protein